VGVRSTLVRIALLVPLCIPSPTRAGPIEQAEKLLRSTAEIRDRDRRFAVADQAKALCEQAIKERPRDPTPHMMLARALTVADPQHPEACRPRTCERAVAELKEARRLDANGGEAQRIANELGLVLSRVGAYEEALVEYERALKLVDGERAPSVFEEYGRSSLYGNSAETMMALGRLPQAIERYREAEATATPGQLEWELAQWGLGVALDRDEQIDKARQAIQRALDFDPTMGYLADDGVFFEPPGDKHYYVALGHEVAGDRDLAIAAWRAFLAEAPASPYARRARAHLAELKRAPAAGVSVDPARVRVSLGEIMDLRGARPAAALRDVVHQHLDELRLCYARTLRSGPSARGDMRLQLLISPSGRAGSHVLMSSVPEEQAGNRLSHCVELATSTWRFTTTESADPEEIVITLHFGGK
jgi:tetratricopeptide (TPR) repeat protein